MKKSLILAVILGLGLSLNTNFSNAETITQPTGPKLPCNCQEKKAPPEFHRGHPCPPPNCKDGKMKPPHHELENKLKLTEDQQNKAREIRMQGREELKPIMDELHAKREKIQQIKASKASDKNKSKQLAKQREEIKALRQKADAIREKNMSQFESILTAEQKAEFDKYKKEMKAKHEEFKKKMEQQRQQNMQPQSATPVQK